MLTSLFRSTSLMYGHVKVHLGINDAQNQITTGLFIGMVPTKKVRSLTPYSHTLNNQHKQIISLVKEKHVDRPLKLVVSVIEPDALDGYGFVSVKSMVSPADWKAEGVSHHLLCMEDLTKNVTNEDAIETIFKMRQCIKSGGSVYVHCKAGRSRSIMICAIYLAVFGTDPNVDREMAFDEVFKLLQEKRPQMDFDADKIAKAKEIIRDVKNRVKYQVNQQMLNAAPKMLNTIMQYLFDDTKLVETLKSKNTREHINSLDELSQLIPYMREPSKAFFSSTKVDPVAEFLKTLHEGNDEKWFYELMHPTGLISTFACHKNQEIKDRALVVKNLQTKVLTYLCKAIPCDEQDLENYLQGYKQQPSKEMIENKQLKKT